MDELEATPLGKTIGLSGGQTVFCPRSIVVADDGKIVEVDGMVTDGVTIR